MKNKEIFLEIIFKTSNKNKVQGINTNTLTIRKEMFYLTTHSTRFIYGYMASDFLTTIPK